MAYPHKRHRFQKFIVFLFAIVIILLVSYFVALPKIKTKAAGVVAEIEDCVLAESYVK